MKQVTRFAIVVLAATIWFGAPPAGARGKAGHGAQQGNGQQGNHDAIKAGPQGDRREVVENRLRALNEHLNLTQGQQIKIRLILVNMVAQANAIRNDKSLTPQQKMQRAQATREAAYDKIAAELTPEQRVKFNNHRAHLAGVGNQGNHGGHQGGNKGDGNKGNNDKDGNNPNKGGAGKGDRDKANNGGPNKGDRDKASSDGPARGDRDGGNKGNRGRRGPRIAPR